MCRASVGPDDYALRILDDLILRAVTYVALDGDRIVGTTTYHEVFDGSAWVSVARTHPAYQGKGVATALVQALEGLARMKGLAALRLWTETTNRAGIATFTKAGFREVARFARRIAPAARGKAPADLRALRLTEDLWSSIETSPILALSRGYVAHGYDFVPLTRGTAHLLANRDALWGWAGQRALLAHLHEWTEDPALQVTALSGDVARILRDAPRIAAARGRRWAVSFLPLDGDVLRTAEASGYRPGSWGREAILCEKTLAPSTVARRARRTYAEIHAAKRTGYAALGLLAPSHGHGPPGPHEDRWNP